MENGTLIRVTDADIKNGAFSFPEGVEAIGHGAFEDCTSLQSIIIPESIKTIGVRAFNGCTSLQSIIIPEGVETIGVGAFEGCTSLRSIIIPEGVQTIGDWAFCGCTSLQSISIPDGVNKIGYGTFYACTSLQSIVIPESIQTIGDRVFNNGTSLSYLYISSTTAAGHQRIVDLLPEQVRSRIVPHELTKKLPNMMNKELHQIVLSAPTNPMARSAKNGLPVLKDILKEINAFLGEDNRFLRKAKRQIAKLPLPVDDKGLSDYQQKIRIIVDEVIVRSQRGLSAPVMPKVLEHLKRLEDQISDLAKTGEHKKALTLQDLCTELNLHHNALVSGRLDAQAFQEQCKQAIEQKYEVLGAQRGPKSVFFFKTDTLNLLDALVEAIKNDMPQGNPSQSSF